MSLYENPATPKSQFASNSALLRSPTAWIATSLLALGPLVLLYRSITWLATADRPPAGLFLEVTITTAQIILIFFSAFHLNKKWISLLVFLGIAGIACQHLFHVIIFSFSGTGGLVGAYIIFSDIPAITELKPPSLILLPFPFISALGGSISRYAFSAFDLPHEGLWNAIPLAAEITKNLICYKILLNKTS